jgi:hypothetical protein
VLKAVFFVGAQREILRYFENKYRAGEIRVSCGAVNDVETCGGTSHFMAEHRHNLWRHSSLRNK